MNKTSEHKVDILTFWGVPNYGAFAQAYALCKVIKQLHPNYKVEHIAYLDKAHYDAYYSRKKPVLRIDSSLFKLITYKNIYRYIINLWHYYFDRTNKYEFFKGIWNVIDHCEIESKRELESANWDYIVTGSDCIWQFSTDMFGCDSHLIGKELNYNKIIAYACSFGNQHGELPEFVFEQLNKYDAISVRDKFSKDITDKLLIDDKNVPVVLDPTLLYDFANDNNIIYHKRTGYILVYGSGFKKDTINEIKSYAKKEKLKLIGAGVGKAPRWCDEVFIEIDPFEWIGMFKNAEFIVTDTFHGMMFSLIYKKKFYFFQEPYVKNRSDTILKITGLDKLFLSNDFSINDMIGFNWDYAYIDKCLEKYKKRSICFLKEALK